MWNLGPRAGGTRVQTLGESSGRLWGNRSAGQHQGILLTTVRTPSGKPGWGNTHKQKPYTYTHIDIHLHMSIRTHINIHIHIHIHTHIQAHIHI